MLAKFSQQKAVAPLSLSNKKANKMAEFVGKYKRTSSEKYEEFLEKLGYGVMIRKAGAMATDATMEVTKMGDKWKIVTASKMRSITHEFEIVSLLF